MLSQHPIANLYILFRERNAAYGNSCAHHNRYQPPKPSVALALPIVVERVLESNGLLWRGIYFIFRFLCGGEGPESCVLFLTPDGRLSGVGINCWCLTFFIKLPVQCLAESSRGAGGGRLAQLRLTRRKSTDWTTAQESFVPRRTREPLCQEEIQGRTPRNGEGGVAYSSSSYAPSPFPEIVMCKNALAGRLNPSLAGHL